MRIADCLSAAEISAYEKLPVPLQIILLQEGKPVDFLAAQGCCQALGVSMASLQGSDPLALAVPEDREKARIALESASLYPGEESILELRVQAESGGILTVRGHARAHVLKSRCALLYVTYEEVHRAEAAESGRDNPELKEAERSQKRELLGIWQVNLTAGQIISMRAESRLAESLAASADYEDLIRRLADLTESSAARQRLRDEMGSAGLLEREQSGLHFSEIGFPHDHECMPSWITMEIFTFHPADRSILQAEIRAYDDTIAVLENQMMSRLTAVVYDIVGLLYVPAQRVRFFNLRKLSLHMTFEQDADYYESIGGDLMNIIAPEDREELRSQLKIENIIAGLRKAPSYMVTYAMIRKDGRHLRKSLQFSWLDDSRKTLFLCRSDITAQYEQEQQKIRELRAAKLEAEQANEAKSRFLSSMSHDLRSPLSGVLGFTELAMREQDLSKCHEDLKKIQSSGTLLLNLVNDTLDLSRIESGRLVLNPQEVMLNELADAVITSLRPSAELKQIDLQADSASFPQIRVRMDPLKFQKIFLNLISNAIKYTPAGGTVSASLKLQEGGDSCIMQVSDTGIGIRPEFLPHLFEAFSQEHRPEAGTVAGTGLGLAIVRRIVTCMNGTISVASTVGTGSQFTVVLPLERCQTEKDEKKGRPDPAALKGRRILVCEDNELNADIVTTLLQEQGMIVEWAANGLEGLRKLEHSEPGTYAAILMDHRMPVMDGCEASQHIRLLDRQDAHRIPIIAMSGDDGGEDDFRSAGMDACIQKPLDSRRLIEVLAELIH